MRGDIMTEKDYKKELKNNFLLYRDTLNFPADITFGLEIEYEGIVKNTVSHILYEQQLDKKLIGWKNKSEFDIAIYNKDNEIINGEINSPILKDTKETWKELRYILELLERHGAFVSDRCGGHVNIGAHIFENNLEYIKNFILSWVLYEKEIRKFSSGENKRLRADVNNLFKKISGKIDLEKLVKNSKNFMLSDELFCLFDKNHSIYIKNPISDRFMFGNVIEFRVPNGTLNQEIWQNYINFFVRFILACKKELDQEKIVYKINNHEHNTIELADFVFDSDLDKEQFLIQTLNTNKAYSKTLIPHKYY